MPPSSVVFSQAETEDGWGSWRHCNRRHDTVVQGHLNLEVLHQFRGDDRALSLGPVTVRHALPRFGSRWRPSLKPFRLFLRLLKTALVGLMRPPHLQ